VLDNPCFRYLNHVFIKSEWILFLFLFKTGFTGLFRIIFFLFQFPDETGKTQSAFSGIKWFIKINFFVVPVSAGFKSNSLITLLWFPILFAGGDWCLSALVRRAPKRENPVNPVDPV
jgi:hypothetical protein